MNLRVLNELGNSDYRVAITPEVAKKLIVGGHSIWIDPDAGMQSGFPDSEYLTVGCVQFRPQDSPSSKVVFSANPLNTGT
ncbi:MAG: hypothetical protein LBC25_02710, partial [Holosporales bacterium]|nr:hypothetical protein [Holosporales bacterium]